MMKKLLFVLMIFVLALAMTACSGKKETSAAAPTAEPTAEPIAEPTTEPAAEAPAGVDLAAVMAGFGLDDSMMTLDASLMLDNYGIEAADMKQFAAAVNTSGTKADEIVLVEAVDAEAAARVKEALDNRYQNKLNETENYLPEENALIKTCQVEISGNFVSMIVSPNAQAQTEAYKAVIG